MGQEQAGVKVIESIQMPVPTSGNRCGAGTWDLLRLLGADARLHAFGRLDLAFEEAQVVASKICYKIIVIFTDIEV